MAIEETPDLADWLKMPSEVAVSAGHPEWTPRQVMAHLEAEGLTDTLLYRRLKKDPNFEEKLLPPTTP